MSRSGNTAGGPGPAQRRQSSRIQNRRGGTLIELSLVLLVVLIVLFGVLEVGRLMLTYETVADAARAGVRYAIVHGADRQGNGVDGPSGPGGNPPQVIAVVQNLAAAAGLSTAKIAVTVTYPTDNKPNSRVTVAASYAFTSVVAVVPLTVTVHSTSQGTICY